MASEVFATDIGEIGALFVRKIIYPEVGDYVTGHDHAMDHVTMVSQGAVHFRCTVTGLDRIVRAPDFVPTPAHARHDMIALEANSCTWCIFALRPEGGYA